MKISYDAVLIALTDAATAHGMHERELGHPDPDWPQWYAHHMLKTLTSRLGDADTVEGGAP